MSRSQAPAGVAGLAIAVALVFGVAAPASAHDELASSNPAASEKLATAPDAVSLTFSGEVMTTGAAVIVVDSDGKDWVAGEPEIVDTTVTATLEPGMPEAGYEIRWRVVSSDGHPISGLVPFTVGDGEPLVRTAPGESAEPLDQSAQEDQTALRVVLIGIGGAVVAVALFTLITLLRRRRARADGTERTDAAASVRSDESERPTL